MITDRPKLSKSGSLATLQGYKSGDEKSDSDLELDGGFGNDSDIENPISIQTSGSSVKFRGMRLLPPEPTGSVDRKVQKKVSDFFSKSAQLEVSFNQSLQKQKGFHNPYILTRIAKLYDIDQTGTNYPVASYNIGELSMSDFYDDIAKQQKLFEDKRAEEKKKRTSIEFTRSSSSTLPILVAPRPSTPTSALTSAPSTQPINGISAGVTTAVAGGGPLNSALSNSVITTISANPSPHNHHNHNPPRSTAIISKTAVSTGKTFVGPQPKFPIKRKKKPGTTTKKPEKKAKTKQRQGNGSRGWWRK